MDQKQRIQQALFTSFAFGNKEVKNRFAMAPMTRSQSPNGVPTDKVVEYYRKRAQGGVGLIITEGVSIDHPGAVGYSDVPNMFGEQACAQWKKVIEAVHSFGSLIIPQLWHVGSLKNSKFVAENKSSTFAPSEILHPFLVNKGETFPEPKAMDDNDISDVIESYCRAAKNAKNCGFDGLEIHGAHGYLIDQFFWQKTNQRNDLYGGNLEGRARFACEIIKAVKCEVGNDFPIVFRFSQWKLGDYDYKMAKSPKELEVFLNFLCQAGVDIFHASSRRYYEAEFNDSKLNLAGWTKKITGKTSISVGSVGLDNDFVSSGLGEKAKPQGIENLLQKMEDNEFDLISVGRALLSDPEWVNKVHKGDFNSINPYNSEDLKALN